MSKEAADMFRRKKRYTLLTAVLLALCVVLAACGASEEKDVSCVIGVTNEGSMYTAII